jgi:hypothetical protein
VDGVEESPDEMIEVLDLVERTRRADVWEAAADERERLSNERESVADEREWLADERDRLLDQREHSVDRLEHVGAVEALDAQTELAAMREAVRRAEPGLGRAEEELARARQAASRAQSRALRGEAAADRAAAAEGLQRVQDDDERAWLVDRRDFVAAERDRLADERDGSAERRDESADQRERLTDERDTALVTREHGLVTGDTARRRAGSSRRTPGADPSLAIRRRVEDRERRALAADRRREASQDRAEAAVHWGPRAYGPHLVASFAELSRRLFAAGDPDSGFSQVLDFAASVMPGCEGASLTLWRGSSVFDTLSTSAAAARLDHVQFSSGEGPVWQAMQDGEAVHVPSLKDDPRWPELAAEAADLGLTEVLCYGLVVDGDTSGSALGSFTLCGGTSEAFGEDEREFGAILAAYLAVGVATARRGQEIDRREAALHRALSSRDVIGQAKGMLMERQGLSAPQAFDVLRRASQRLNLRLTELAEQLTATGRLPSEPRGTTGDNGR